MVTPSIQKHWCLHFGTFYPRSQPVTSAIPFMVSSLHDMTFTRHIISSFAVCSMRYTCARHPFNYLLGTRICSQRPDQTGTLDDGVNRRVSSEARLRVFRMRRSGKSFGRSCVHGNFYFRCHGARLSPHSRFDTHRSDCTNNRDARAFVIHGGLSCRYSTTYLYWPNPVRLAVRLFFRFGTEHVCDRRLQSALVESLPPRP